MKKNKNLLLILQLYKFYSPAGRRILIQNHD